MTSGIEGFDQPKKRRFAILTAASLSSNPRAFKEAETIANAGFEVVVYGASFDVAQRQTDEGLAVAHGFSFKSVLSVGEDRIKPQLLAVWPRIRTRVGVHLHRYLRVENACQL